MAMMLIIAPYIRLGFQSLVVEQALVEATTCNCPGIQLLAGLYLLLRGCKAECGQGEAPAVRGLPSALTKA